MDARMVFSLWVRVQSMGMGCGQEWVVMGITLHCHATRWFAFLDSSWPWLMFFKMHACLAKCLGLDQYRVSADTRQYWWVSVLAYTCLSIGADTSSPVSCLYVSTVNTVATHGYSFKPIPYFQHFSHIYPHTYITCTHLYPAQNRIFSTKNLYSLVSVSV